jgi:hypothetical protein
MELLSYSTSVLGQPCRTGPRGRTWQANDDDLLALDILGDVDLLGRKAEVEFETWDLVPCFDRSHVTLLFVLMYVTTRTVL